MVYKENSESLCSLFVSAIYNYSIEHYKVINDALLFNKQSDLEEHGPFIKILREAILVANQTDLPEKVYRKIYLCPEEIESYKQKSNSNNQLFCIPSFISTTTNFEVLEKFDGNYIIEIILTRNCRTNVCSIEKYSQYPNEKEVLITPYSWFNLAEVDDRRNIITLFLKDYTFQPQAMPQVTTPPQENTLRCSIQ